MSSGSGKRARPSDSADFPKRSPSVKPPPWLSPHQTAVRTVDFREPASTHAAPPAPPVDPAIEAKTKAEAAARAATEAAAKEAERKAEQERRVQQELQQRSERLAQAITEAVGLRARLLQETETQLVELAVQIASAIVEREIQIDPEVHGRLAQAALACLGQSDRATLRASKVAYEAIVASLGGNNVRLDGVQVQVVSDASIEGFGCVVETSDTRIDARVQSRLKEVLDGLRDENRRASEEAA